MHEAADARVRRRSRHSRRAFQMNGIKRLPPARRQDANEVNNRVRAFYGRAHRGWIAQIGLHGVDLPDIPHRLQMAGKIRPPNRRPHAPSLPRERPHRVPANKARTAKNRNKLAMPRP